jgi:hypothetical protein
MQCHEHKPSKKLRFSATQTHTPPCKHTQRRAHAHRHTHTQTQTHTFTHTHTRMHMHHHKITQTHTHAHIRTHRSTRTQAHKRLPRETQDIRVCPRATQGALCVRADNELKLESARTGDISNHIFSESQQFRKARSFLCGEHKTTEQTKVLSESDVYFSSPPELAQLMATRSSTN